MKDGYFEPGDLVIVDNCFQGEIISQLSGNVYRVEVDDPDKPRHETWTIHVARLDFIPPLP